MAILHQIDLLIHQLHIFISVPTLLTLSVRCVVGMEEHVIA